MPPTDPRALTEEEHVRLASHVMRRQAALSLRVAFVFLTLVLGLPLVNFLAPALANYRIAGFTATWLFLGVLFYPITVALSFYFVRHSDRIENECKDWRGILDAEDRVR